MPHPDDDVVAGLSLPQRAHEAAGWVDAGILDLKRALGYLTDAATVEELEKLVVGCTLLRERVRSTPRLCAKVEPEPPAESAR